MEHNRESEQLFIQAVIQARKEMMAEIESHIDDKHKFSPKFTKNMNKLVKEQYRKNHKTYAMLKRAAAIIVIILTFTMAAMSVEAIRTKVMQIIIQIFDDSSQLTFKNTDENIDVKDFDKIYMPTYMTEGFVLNKEKSFEGMIYMYENTEGNRIVYKFMSGKSVDMLLDTEGTKLYDIKINECEGFYFENKGIKRVLWYNKTHVFMVSSSISKEELIKIAENVK